VEGSPLVGVGILLLIAYVFFYLPRSQIRHILVIVILFMIGYALVVTVAEMPVFGSADSPAYNHVAKRYIEGTVSDTGAVNAISAIIMDYRAFDTLGEATVLFVAIAAAIANLKAH
jgi:multisubunit Na+/H+ antiporter MnhB subunit